MAWMCVPTQEVKQLFSGFQCSYTPTSSHWLVLLAPTRSWPNIVQPSSKLLKRFTYYSYDTGIVSLWKHWVLPKLQTQNFESQMFAARAIMMIMMIIFHFNFRGEFSIMGGWGPVNLRGHAWYNSPVWEGKNHLRWRGAEVAKLTALKTRVGVWLSSVISLLKKVVERILLTIQYQVRGSGCFIAIPLSCKIGSLCGTNVSVLPFPLERNKISWWFL